MQKKNFRTSTQELQENNVQCNSQQSNSLMFKAISLKIKIDTPAKQIKGPG